VPGHAGDIGQSSRGTPGAPSMGVPCGPSTTSTGHPGSPGLGDGGADAGSGSPSASRAGGDPWGVSRSGRGSSGRMPDPSTSGTATIAGARLSRPGPVARSLTVAGDAAVLASPGWLPSGSGESADVGPASASGAPSPLGGTG